jgi:hypothetical protein
MGSVALYIGCWVSQMAVAVLDAYPSCHEHDLITQHAGGVTLAASNADGSRAPNAQWPAKSRLLAVLLQCLPLLFVGGCLASTFGPAGWYLASPGDWILSVLGVFVFAWGLGYVYLGQYRRFIHAAYSAVVLSIFAWWLNLVLLDGCNDLGASLQCPQRVRIFDRPLAVLTAAVVGVWVVVYSRDAFRLVTTLQQGRSEEAAGRRSFFGRVSLVSVAIGIAVLGFYVSPYCSRLWESTK